MLLQELFSPHSRKTSSFGISLGIASATNGTVRPDLESASFKTCMISHLFESKL